MDTNILQELEQSKKSANAELSSLNQESCMLQVHKDYLNVTEKFIPTQLPYHIYILPYPYYLIHIRILAIAEKGLQG